MQRKLIKLQRSVSRILNNVQRTTYNDNNGNIIIINLQLFYHVDKVTK